jgi:hypothetical protein
MNTTNDLLRIEVDFNTLNGPPVGSVYVPTHVFPQLVPLLRPGMRVLLAEGASSESIEVEGVLHRDEQHGQWCAKPDWSTLRYV